MNLDEAQRRKVATWISEGLKISDIQNRLQSEMGIRMTYMEVRLLVDDLKLTPKDAEPVPESPVVPGSTPGAPKATAGKAPAPSPSAAPAPPPSRPGGVLVNVDQLARPGALVSGKVTFSDGVTAEWQLDQAGRLGLIPRQAGYRPSAADVSEFQAALETELSKIGF
jgi:hypothetical protein